MKVSGQNGWIHYDSVRHRTTEFRGRYRPIAPVVLRKPGSLEHWLTERYCLYTIFRNSVYRAEIHHAQWPLQDAEAEFASNTMASSAGIDLPKIQPLLHFSKQLQVLVWPLKRT
jgi:hypothetical protein